MSSDKVKETKMASNNNNNNIEGLKGTWDYVSGENFDKILKELGVNKVFRTIAKSVKPRLIINEKNGKWLFKSESTFKTTSYEFTPGVQFEDITPDGQKINMIIRFENGKWIQTSHQKDGKEMVLERWINNEDQLEVSMKCGTVEANQLFRRVG